MKTKRHSKILELISEKDIATQEDLLVYLRESGFDVTQATVSRDIKELRLVKKMLTPTSAPNMLFLISPQKALIMQTI